MANKSNPQDDVKIIAELALVSAKAVIFGLQSVGDCFSEQTGFSPNVIIITGMDHVFQRTNDPSLLVGTDFHVDASYGWTELKKLK